MQPQHTRFYEADQEVMICYSASSFWLAILSEHASCTSERFVVDYSISHETTFRPYLLQMEPKFDVHCIISAEPLRGPVSKRMDKGSKVFSDMALCRQDVWLSRSQARTYFESHPFTKSWHPTVRKLFLVRKEVNSDNVQVSEKLLNTGICPC